LLRNLVRGQWLTEVQPRGTAVPRWRTSSLVLLAAAWSATPAIVRAQDTAPAAEPPASDVPQLRATLLDPQSRQDQRDLAAARLLARPDPAARTAIRDALSNPQLPQSQLASARALAANPQADNALVAPLFALIDPNSTKPLIDSAAHALTAFKDQPDVLARLLTLARDGSDERIRLATIRAAGTFIDKRVAQLMLELMDPTQQPTSINQAAEDALAYMTGLDVETNDLASWRAWWASHRDVPDQQFRADLNKARAARYDAARAAVVDLQDELGRILNEQYQRTPRAQQMDVLLRYLRSNQATVRAIGAAIAGESAKAGATAPTVVEQLRILIGDASPDVRRQTAIALSLINDSESLLPLLTQLNQEPDSTVREAIAQALRPITDIRSVKPLLALLDDPRQETAQAAAAALSEPELGSKLRKADPALADAAAQQLWKTLQGRTTAQNNTDLRYDIIRAIIPLRSKSLSRDLLKVLNKAEVPKVRRAVLSALGELRDPELSGAIGELLDDPDPTIRLEAVNAIGRSQAPFIEFQGRLRDRLDPKKETSPEVREAAWNALTEMFTRAPSNQLPFWVDFLKTDPARQVVVLKILRDRAKASGDAEGEAANNQRIGDAYSRAIMWEDAVPFFRDAFQFNVVTNRPAGQDIISESLITALLRARKYEDAVKFAEDQIRRSPRFNELGSFLRREIERLYREEKDYDSARQLIDRVLKMNPPLMPQQAEMIKSIDTEMQRRQRERNLTPHVPFDPALNASAD
jgi:HEAT repeat protein